MLIGFPFLLLYVVTREGLKGIKKKKRDKVFLFFSIIGPQQEPARWAISSVVEHAFDY